MGKLFDDNFALEPDGTIAMFTRVPNVLNNSSYWDMPSAGSTITVASGWVHSSVNVEDSIHVAVPATTDYHMRAFIRYPLAAINTADTFDMGLQMGASYSSTQRNLVRINPHSTNIFQVICRKHNATLGSTTNLAKGPGGVNGSNNNANGFWLGLMKLSNKLYITYDMGQGMEVTVPGGTADGGYTTADGYPFIHFKAATWEVQRVQLWTPVADPATGFIDTGQFDPAIDPDLQPCLRRHMKFWAEEQPRSYLVGGWYAPNGSADSTAWTNASQVTPGKFTDGFVYSSGSNNAGYYPAHGLIPTHDFTLGVWVEPTVDFTSITSGAVFMAFGDDDSNTVSINKGTGNTLNLVCTKNFGPPIALVTLAYTLPYNVTWLAGEKRLIWLTVDSAGMTEIGLDQFTMRGGASAPFQWGARMHDCSYFEPGTTMNGLRFATAASGTRYSQLKISDFFVLSGCQYPGHTAATLPENVLTVDPTTAPPRLSLTTKHFGTLGRKNLTDWATVVAGSQGAVRIAKGTLAMPSRFDSTVSCEAPGLTPSSPWNYDINSGLWDRDWAQAFASVNFGGGNYGYIYCDIGGVPQVLQDAGGSTSSYYTGSNLSGNTSNSAAWVASIPNDGTNTGTIAGHTVVLSAGTINKMAMNKVDYILYAKAYCLANSLPFDHIIWESWNEFLSGSFWNIVAFANPTTEFMKIWNAVVDLAQTNVDANFKLCIPSTVQYAATGIPACMAAAVAAGNGAAIKAIAPHDYQGDVYSQTYAYAAQCETDRVASSVAQVVPFIHDEDTFSNIYAPGTGAPNQFLNADRPMGASAITAAWVLSKIIGCARCLEMTAGVGGGVEAYIFTGAKVDHAASDVYQETGLVEDSGTYITAVGNAYHLGLMCAIDTPGTSGRVHGTSTYVGDPLGGHVVTVESTGIVNILIVHLRSQQDSLETIRVSLPITHAGRTVTKYVVDDQKASYYDTAGSSIALVQEAAGNLDANGDISITMRGQSVVLLQVALTGGGYATASGPNRGGGIKIGGVGIR